MHKYQDGIISFLQRLVRTKSVNGENYEIEVVKVIEEECDKLGLPYKRIETEENRPNIVVGSDIESQSNMILVAHTDTVATGDYSKWEVDPFSGGIVDNKIYGRGVLDCKGGVALSLYALKILKDRGELHKAKFIGVVDEESGASSEKGLKYVLYQGITGKAAIYTYGGSSLKDAITIGHRGVIRLTVKVCGQATHSGSKDWQDRVKGADANTALAEFITKLGEVNFDEENRFFPGYRFTMTPTLISGGVGESIVSDNAECLLDIRTLPGQSLELILEKLKRIASNIETEKIKLSFETKINVPATVSDPESDFLQSVHRLISSRYNTNPIFKGSGPANESYMLIEKGIPTLVGLGLVGEGFHANNEYGEIDSIEESLDILLGIVNQVVR